MTEWLTLSHQIPVKNRLHTLISWTVNFILLYESFFCYFIEVQLIYNVGLISTVQQSDSVIIYIYFFFFKFFPIMVYHRILSIAPCAIQQDLVVYPLHLLIPNSQSIPLPYPLHLSNHKSVLYFSIFFCFICVIF